MRKIDEHLAPESLDYTFFAPASRISPVSRTDFNNACGRRQVLPPAGAGPSTIGTEDCTVALLDEIETGTRRGRVFQFVN